jgi:hypothetical protein
MNTFNKISKYLRILIDSDDVYQNLQKRFPELLDDLISAKTNPSCTCNQRVIEGLIKRYKESDEDKNFIEDIFANPEIVESIKSYDESIELWEKKENEFFGKVHIVGKTSEDWLKFHNFIKNQPIHIRAVSVIEKADNFEVRFI